MKTTATQQQGSGNDPDTAQGSIVTPVASGYTDSIQPAGGWWAAFGTSSFEGEPPLLEGQSGSAFAAQCFLTCAYYRARHQLLSHTRQVHDGSKSLSLCQQVHDGRRRPRWAPHLLLLLHHIPPFRTCAKGESVKTTRQCGLLSPAVTGCSSWHLISHFKHH
jgi:hypothetical protein